MTFPRDDELPWADPEADPIGDMLRFQDAIYADYGRGPDDPPFWPGPGLPLDRLPADIKEFERKFNANVTSGEINLTESDSIPVDPVILASLFDYIEYLEAQCSLPKNTPAATPPAMEFPFGKWRGIRSRFAARFRTGRAPGSPAQAGS